MSARSAGMLVALVLHHLLVTLGLARHSDAVRAVWAALVLSRWLLIPIAPRRVLRVGLRLWLVLSILQILLLIRADVLILAWRGVSMGMLLEMALATAPVGSLKSLRLQAAVSARKYFP